eukprot:m.353730 g.353730  ORF g.353730 m.353730 type:complete len:288 (+) comp16829_c0_seq1:516-1379(+)
MEDAGQAHISRWSQPGSWTRDEQATHHTARRLVQDHSRARKQQDDIEQERLSQELKDRLTLSDETVTAVVQANDPTPDTSGASSPTYHQGESILDQPDDNDAIMGTASASTVADLDRPQHSATHRLAPQQAAATDPQTTQGSRAAVTAVSTHRRSCLTPKTPPPQQQPQQLQAVSRKQIESHHEHIDFQRFAQDHHHHRHPDTGQDCGHDIVSQGHDQEQEQTQVSFSEDYPLPTAELHYNLSVVMSMHDHLPFSNDFSWDVSTFQLAFTPKLNDPFKKSKAKSMRY